jgi:hypothetical protein
MSRLTRWIFEVTDNSNLAFVFVVAVLIGCGYLLAGCSSIHVTTPEGYTASYTRIGDQEISGLRFEKDSTGLTRIVLDKQASKSDVVLNALKALVEGAE